MCAGCAHVRPGCVGNLICPFEVTMIRSDSCMLRLLVNALECILILVCESWMLGTSVCIQDVWERSFVNSEVTVD